MHKLDRIVVAIDFSAASRAALDYGRFFAEKVGATLDVLHIADPGEVRGVDDVSVLNRGVPGSTLEIQHEAEIKVRLDAFVKEAGLGRPVRNDEIEQSDEPAELLVKLAAARGYDAIIVGTNARSGLERLFMGSVAQKVVQLAPCPVLVIRKPE